MEREAHSIGKSGRITLTDAFQVPLRRRVMERRQRFNVRHFVGLKVTAEVTAAAPQVLLAAHRPILGGHGSPSAHNRGFFLLDF